MSELQDFLTACQMRGKMTLSDHLTLSGYTDDSNKRKSMTTQVVRALLDHPHYQELRGTVICPSENVRAKWAEGVDRLPDVQPPVSFTTSLVINNAMGSALVDPKYRYTGTEQKVRNALAAIATAPNRKQEVVVSGFASTHEELDYERELRQSAETECERLRQQIVKQTQQITDLIALVARSSGTEVVAFSKSEGEPKVLGAH